MVVDVEIFNSRIRQVKDLSLTADTLEEKLKSFGYSGKWYNVGLMLGSKRSLGYRIKKVFRHKPIDTIDIELNKSDADVVGDFMLYTPNHINQLLHIIKSK